MAAPQAIFLVQAGPNAGDSVRVERGGCRLIGRHLSDNETAFMDREGNRKLDAAAAQILTEHMHDQGGGDGDDASDAPRSGDAPEAGNGAEPGGEANYDRGPDIVFSDDAISRAHAMLFFDVSGALGVIDLASTNGTFVNDHRVTSSTLKDGDVVMLGGSKLKVGLR